MFNRAPRGTLGLANPSGWMTTELFLQVLEDFIKYSTRYLRVPSLLIFDNHESFVTVEVVMQAQEAGVHILMLPPYCSNKLEPLDVAVFGPFKAYYNAACEAWLLNHPGEPITIYNTAELVDTAHDKALLPQNILSGFEKADICPIN
ncbi:uncharacterized protein [Diabrotica undecimpunctata]|uniref:uncharacterized protein n=1 Tax=Diabrotica undecimpunctata TaxID=50387 RepID=UPI003B640099